MEVSTIINWVEQRLLIFCGLYVTTVTIGLMHTSYGLIPFGLAAAFLLLTCAVGIGMIVQMLERKAKTKVSRWFHLVGLLTFFSIICFFLAAIIQGFITDHRAERIILWLEEYRKEKGFYPPDLEDLTKQHLGRIPPTAYGLLRQDFQYNGYFSGKFQINYFSYFGVEHTYSSITKEWEVDD